MDMKNYSSFMPSTDSSEDGLSNDEGDGDRSPFQYSPVPPVATVGSNDESYALDDEICSYSSATSGFSSATTYSAGSSSYPHNIHSAQHMFNYEPSTQSHSSSLRKRKTEHSDNELSDYGFGDDGASTISNVSNNSKKKKYDFDACAREVEQNFHVDSKALELMKKMGYKKGKGLGAHQQGITEPIQESKQRGRSGLGHSVKQLEPANLIWDDSYEEVSVEEYPVWLDGDHLPTLTHNELCDWVKEGPRIMVMDGYTDFCDPELLQDILESKNVFDNLGDRELNTAVKRSNPFETISSGIFLNRAAMKMANMDRVFDYMFTDPMDRNNRPIIGETDLLYFADVCAGPGGFSEYVLWKRNWQAKGIGFTLKNECDFKLEDFFAGTPESFEPYYGRKGDGNVFDPENIESLTKFVMAKTDNLGVHFMMADGGFSVAGQENIQEIMSKQLYLCQLLVALCIVRTGGHFVCKLFDVFTPFSVGLVYLMYRSFQKICIHKPNSSRPANSERYIICKFKRADCEDIRSYMFDLNIHLNNLGPNSDIDVNDCVSMNELLSDSMFFNYITDSNKRLGRRQLVHLKKVIAFCRDPKLVETKQSDLRIKCLEYWKVPSTVRKPDSTSAEAMAAQILKNSNYDFAANPGDELNSEEKLKALFPSLLDWLCIPVFNHNECYFYIGCRNKVYMLRKNGKGWINLDAKIKLELSPGTLVYGEIVEEVTGCNRSQIRDKFFHIIDAFSLGKKNIISRSIPTRLQLCKLYAKALHKHWRIHISTNSYNSSSPIPPLSLRANDYFELKNLMEIFERLEFRTNKLRREEILIGLKDELPRLNFDHHDSLSELSDKYFFPVKGLLFYKTTRNPWTVHFSKSHRKIYYYKKGGESVFEKPNDINASAIDCFINRKLWTWDQGVGIKGESPMDGVLHMSQLLEFIKNARR